MAQLQAVPAEKSKNHDDVRDDGHILIEHKMKLLAEAECRLSGINLWLSHDQTTLEQLIAKCDGNLEVKLRAEEFDSDDKCE